MNERIISALVGLCGAIEISGKTENTDVIIRNALLASFTDDYEQKVIADIHKEKFLISPNCATCANPCGNTSDYSLEKYYSKPELKTLKEEMMQETADLIKRLKGCELPDCVFQAISYFGYDLVQDSYINLTNVIKQMEK